MIYICKFIKIFNNNLTLTFPEQSGDHGVRQQKPFGGDRQPSVAQGGVARVEPRARRVEQGFEPRRIEGYQSAMWVVLDYYDVIVHIFYDKTREFYSLERLWADAPRVDLGLAE